MDRSRLVHPAHGGYFLKFTEIPRANLGIVRADRSYNDKNGNEDPDDVFHETTLPEMS
jgi:hypothetical protein